MTPDTPIPEKIRTSALTGNVDFAPTILRLAGLSIPENMDGKDLMKVYENPRISHHSSLPLINVWGNAPTHMLGIVTEKMKYLYWGYAGEGFNVTEELYNLKKDPMELHNQIGNRKYKQSLKHLRKLYDQQLAHWKKRVGSLQRLPKIQLTF